MSPFEVVCAIRHHAHGAWAHLRQRHPEAAVLRAFLYAERAGWIEREDKLSHAHVMPGAPYHFHINLEDTPVNPA